jgi:hypothetical protein
MLLLFVQIGKTDAREDIAQDPRSPGDAVVVEVGFLFETEPVFGQIRDRRRPGIGNVRNLDQQVLGADRPVVQAGLSPQRPRGPVASKWGSAIPVSRKAAWGATRGDFAQALFRRDPCFDASHQARRRNFRRQSTSIQTSTAALAIIAGSLPELSSTLRPPCTTLTVTVPLGSEAVTCAIST